MKKIKIAMITDSLRLDGITAVIMNYCSHLNLNQFDITIIVGAPISEIHRKKCDEFGIEMIELSQRKTSTKNFYLELNKKLGEKHYDICHVHGNSATNVVELMLAKINHIKIRIMHCHNAQCQHERIHTVLLPVFKRMYTDAFACSSLAGNWIFGENKFTTIPNGFHTEEFKFSVSNREQYRKQLNLEGFLVIGHVGQINYQKNSWFTIKCFAKYAEENHASKLLMVGTGREKKDLEEYAEKLGLKDRIIIYGESTDISGLLSAMDVFLFPSRYEGLGISVIEAQVSGLPCIISTAVPREVVVGENVTFLPIEEENIALWVDAIWKFGELKIDRLAFFKDNKMKIEKYNIVNCVKFLENIYLQLYSTTMN